MRLPGTYINPAETGFYYLQTRYYDAEIGRFINADGLVSTGQGILGNSMFAYCNNNPVMYSDPKGTIGTLVILGILLGVASVICASIDIADAIKPATKTVRALTDTLDTISNGASLYSTLAETDEAFDTATATKIAHTANVVDLGSSQYNGNSIQVEIPNRDVFFDDAAYQNLCATSYTTLIEKTSLELDRDINGLSWDQLTADEQKKLVNTIGAWDPATSDNIAWECCEKVVGGIFG